MFLKNPLKKISIFSAAFLIGISAVSVYREPNRNEPENLRIAGKREKSANQKTEKVGAETIDSSGSMPLKILYKPQPAYTKEAKNNNIQGVIRVRVAFLDNGKIGKVDEIAGLPFGLTEKAVEAAAKIRFKPQIENGKAISVTKVVAFTFKK